MTTAADFFRALEKKLVEASYSKDPHETMRVAIKRHYSNLFATCQHGMLLIRNGDSPWLCVEVEGPGKFKLVQNHRPDGPILADFTGYCSVHELVREIALLAGRELQMQKEKEM